jgi:hypothetical protein
VIYCRTFEHGKRNPFYSPQKERKMKEGKVQSGSK